MEASGLALINQFWACLDIQTETEIVHKGLAKEKDLQILINEVKDLVLEKRNKLVQQYEFSHIKQEKDEKVSKYLAKLQGRAELCQFSSRAKCPCGCDYSFDHSYKEELVLDQFIKGLKEKDWTEKLIAWGDKLTLAKAVNQIEGLEVGKTTVAQINEKAGEINKVSEHKERKQNAKPKYFGNSQDKREVENKSCTNCGSNSH